MTQSRSIAQEALDNLRNGREYGKDIAVFARVAQAQATVALVVATNEQNDLIAAQTNAIKAQTAMLEEVLLAL